jgi:uncharacterized Zn-finger protein
MHSRIDDQPVSFVLPTVYQTIIKPKKSLLRLKKLREIIEAQPFTREQLKSCANQVRPDVKADNDCVQAVLAMVGYLNTTKIIPYTPDSKKKTTIYQTVEKIVKRTGIIKDDYYTEEIRFIKDQTSPLNRFLVPMNSNGCYTIDDTEKNIETFYSPEVIQITALNERLTAHAENNGGFGTYVIYFSRCVKEKDDEFQDGHVICAYVVTAEFNKEHGNKLKPDELVTYIELQNMSTNLPIMSSSLNELDYNFINKNTKNIKDSFDTCVSVVCAGTALIQLQSLKQLQSLRMRKKIKFETISALKTQDSLNISSLTSPPTIGDIPLSSSSYSMATNSSLNMLGTQLPFSIVEPLLKIPSIAYDINLQKRTTAPLTKSPKKRSRNTRNKSSDGERIGFLCTYTNCKKSFAVKSNLVRHKKRHYLEPQFSCHCCSKRFFENYALQRHEKTHMDLSNNSSIFPEISSFSLPSSTEKLPISSTRNESTIGFRCTYQNCNKSFSYKFNLTRHKKRHSEPQFGCHCCSKRFIDNSELKRHEKIHKKKNPELNMSLAPTALSNSSSVFPEISFFSLPSSTEKLPISSSPTIGEMPLSPSNYSTVSNNSLDLLNRQLASSPASIKDIALSSSGVDPSICSTSSPMSYDINLQEKTTAPLIETTKECSRDTRNTSSNGKLISFQCTYSNCNKSLPYSFSQESALKSHMKRHSEKANLSCPCCSKRFFESCNLKRHMHTHKNKKPELNMSLMPMPLSNSSSIFPEISSFSLPNSTEKLPISSSPTMSEMPLSSSHYSTVTNNSLNLQPPFFTSSPASIKDISLSSSGVDPSIGSTSSSMSYDINLQERTTPPPTKTTKKRRRNISDESSDESSDENTIRFKCTYSNCTKSYTKNFILKRHLKKHSAPTLSCTCCPKRFFDNSDLKRHEKTHIKGKIHPCSFFPCEKRFKDTGALKRHLGTTHQVSKNNIFLHFNKSKEMMEKEKTMPSLTSSTMPS